MHECCFDSQKENEKVSSYNTHTHNFALKSCSKQYTFYVKRLRGDSLIMHMMVGQNFIFSFLTLDYQIDRLAKIEIQ